jgi:carnosine synthase
LKPVSGAAASFTERVDSMDEAVAAYERISPLVNPASDPIFANNSDLLLMQRLDGSEYDVDLVMRDGSVLFESIADNKPTQEPSYLATGSRLPSVLSAADQRAAIDQSVASARALGLTDGVIHMEGKVTSAGPRLIEANPRMGGSYVRDWVLGVWGVDMVEEGLMAAAGVGGKTFKPARPLIHLDGDFLNSDKPGVIRVLELPEAARKMPGFVRFREVMRAGQTITPLMLSQTKGYARAAMLEVGGATAEEARKNLEAIKAKIRFEVE